MAKNRLQQLADKGQSVWFDNLSRDLLLTGGLIDLIDNSAVVGVTSNPSIFDKAISGSDSYDDQIRELALAGRTAHEIFDGLAVQDIRTAADQLRATWEETGANSGDGYVSLEVAPGLAHDTEGTEADVRRLADWVDRPNLMIKIPGTVEGTPAIEQMLYEGYNINITLLFSLQAYKDVMEAYLKALERRQAEGLPLDTVHSVASFFVSRVDTEADKRLQQIIDKEPGSERAKLAESLLGKLAVANAKLAYREFKDVFGSERFAKLAADGARIQRPLWASTSTKNPAYSDTLYVDELIGADTVQTLTQGSIDAFLDHGTVVESAETDIAGAKAVFDGFDKLGISVDDITDTLVAEGVAAFSKAFEALLSGVEAKRVSFLDKESSKRGDNLGALREPVDKVLAKLDADNVGQRLQQRDASLWSSDADVAAKVDNRLGWLKSLPAMLAQAHDGTFDEFAADVQHRGYQHVVLLGMGGSSLAPEVLATIYGSYAGFPKLTVLDTTNPDTIARVRGETLGTKTLFIVSTKSGTTIETMSLCHYFLNQRNAEDFIAITDPDTTLVDEAMQAGFWRTFVNPADIGGRYSALSYFGLVPAAAIGVDTEDLLVQADTLLPIRDSNHPGVWLGAVLAAAHAAGRDKLTILAEGEWQAFGTWLEQLIAESTGKQGVGIVPVVGETYDSAANYGNDRLFVVLRTAGSERYAERVAALRDAGQPVVDIEVNDPSDLGREFMRWEIATAVAGHLLGINPFDEPNVQEAKDATNAVLADSTGEPAGGTADDLAGFMSAVMPGDYVALLAYVDHVPATQQALDALRTAIGRRTGAATTLGYGPRYLHSTGQLHKGGAATGHFLQLVQSPDADGEIPNQPFGFATLFAAQSAGDALTLAKHDLPLLRIDLGSDAAGAIGTLTDTIGAPAGVSND